MRVDYAALTPELIVAGTACLVLVLDLGLRGRARVASGVLALLATLAAAASLVPLIGTTPRVTLAQMFVLDDFALLFKALFLGVGVVVLLISLPWMRGHRNEGEYYVLFLCSVLGTILMPSSRDLLMLFISLELVSLPAFVIAGLRKQDPRSNEAALKFFLFGVLSAGALAYAISLIYGVVGTTNLAAINDRLTGPPAEPLLLTGIVLLIAGFGFKISAVPFHFWAPDTYEGSPVPLAAFLSVGSKAAGFAGLALILVTGLPKLAPDWSPIIAILSVLTMTVGNVVALRQRHLVRLLAYSSIAQAGYMLIPLAVVRPPSGSAFAANAGEVTASLLLYLLIYAVMNLGAFSLVVGMSKQYPTLLIRDLAGLGRRAPVYALAMAAFLISLGGIPPLAGWAAKFFVFLTAVGSDSSIGVALAVVMVVNSVVSLYYYFGVVKTMYLEAPREEAAFRVAPAAVVAVTVCLVGVVALGVYPETFMRVARAASLTLP